MWIDNLDTRIDETCIYSERFYTKKDKILDQNL